MIVPQAYTPPILVLNGWFDTDQHTLTPAVSAANDSYHSDYLGDTAKNILSSFPSPKWMAIESRRFAFFGPGNHYQDAFDLFLVLSRRERTSSMMNNSTFYRHFNCPQCGRRYPPVDANVFVDLSNKILIADRNIVEKLTQWGKM